MYFESLRAGMLTLRVSQARKQPNAYVQQTNATCGPFMVREELYSVGNKPKLEKQRRMMAIEQIVGIT
jgi:hypothetical protein